MLKCSHGLAYESKCWGCVSEALARVTLDTKLSTIKNSVPEGVVGGVLLGLQRQVDRIQVLS